MVDVLSLPSSFLNVGVLYLVLMISISYCFICLLSKAKRKRKEVIVITRYPVAGKAKTRLIPALGQDAASRLQTHMTEHIIGILQKVYSGQRDISVTLQFNGGTREQMRYWLDRRLWGLPCEYRPQVGTNLGEKMKMAVKDSFNRGFQHVVVIGADIPGITDRVIQTAFDTLAKPDVDMVIGRAEDGGYYLIGFNTEASKYIDRVFDDIEWGTDKVFLQQINKAKDLKAKIEILPFVLQDVDTEEDISVFEREVGISCADLCDTSWSIIVPVLNERQNVTDMLENVFKECTDIKNIRQVLIVDGGSRDSTVEIVKEFSKTSSIPVQVLSSKAGRGNQLMLGAEKATSSNFLFLHADTRLPRNFDTLALDCLNKPGVVAGAFPLQLDVLADSELKKKESWWFILQMKCLVWGSDIRTKKFEKPYGDQAIFMKRDVYQAVGGFPPYFLMEDYVMVEKLKTLGHISVVDGHPITTSYRRWKKWGYLKVTGLSQLIILAYHLGVHPNTLAKWYYGDKVKID